MRSDGLLPWSPRFLPSSTRSLFFLDESQQHPRTAIVSRRQVLAEAGRPRTLSLNLTTLANFANANVAASPDRGDDATSRPKGGDIVEPV